MASGTRDGGKAIISKVSVREQLPSCDEHRRPKVVDRTRGRYVRPVELSGDLLRHHHEDVVVEEGEFTSVSHRAEPRFVMEEEVRELLAEPVFAVGAANESIVELERI
ncbi:MAG: hypothetical protein AVDCRST_MAG28-1526 [uncultured Rubrobacteraceae bacterium]|uniref:Uncharacterized protein n=1 Tax=uncultured Rubrobacteraceae bacterium TaxID=349277 RepID=A0A6J4Q1Q5_9ACTN|nr:MAG: hypothetical protein AVDCRST_MAG28-1526 [uncultured Rubrobacteraceae bacterium]